MSILSKLFGGGGATPSGPDPVTHGDFLIFPSPAKDKDGFRIGARIEKDVGGEVKVHQMIRADTYGSEDVAIEASIAKARQVIDQLGERVFQ